MDAARASRTQSVCIPNRRMAIGSAEEAAAPLARPLVWSRTTTMTAAEATEVQCVPKPH